MDRINAEVFVTVSELGSYRKAAEKLGYTQAGISYIVSAMEERAGFPLFVREYGGVRLSPEGEALLPSMKKLYDTEKMVTEHISQLKGLTTGHVRVLSVNTVFVCWLPDIIRGFHEKYPGIRIETMSCEGPGQAERMILDNKADCGFLATDHTDKIQLFNLRTEPDVAVVALNHPMADAEIFTLQDMEKYPFIGYPEDEAPYVYDLAREKSIKFNQVATISNDYGNFAMISENLGFGIYPKMMVDKCMFPVRGIPIENGSSTPFSLGVKSYESCSLAAKAFIDYVLNLDL